MTDKRGAKTKLSDEKLMDIIRKKIKEDYMKNRITDAEYYNIQTNLLIWRQLHRIANALEKNKK